MANNKNLSTRIDCLPCHTRRMDFCLQGDCRQALPTPPGFLLHASLQDQIHYPRATFSHLHRGQPFPTPPQKASVSPSTYNTQQRQTMTYNLPDNYHGQEDQKRLLADTHQEMSCPRP